MTLATDLLPRLAFHLVPGYSYDVAGAQFRRAPLDDLSPGVVERRPIPSAPARQRLREKLHEFQIDFPAWVLKIPPHEET